ncbi:putative F-box/FBD/LRR-repeat protein At5g56810 [Phragmites australis]|uniref:putative F-box/FBD/LRR-repeat protein At5g56810 n=1 Tax=Phragmites australis TaxID=29695 RepID=UPI002D7A2ECA|nr:putative F-box/FBD/LRR-repeat protein At5g56810 [Phragmites australis]
MALESDGDGGRGKRQRVDEQEAQRKELAAAVAGQEAAVPVVRISALPNDLRHRILTYLPLKDAIRTAVLAKGWRDLWKSRWAHPTSCRDIHLLPDDNPRKMLGPLVSGPRRRLDRFSLIVENEKLRPQHLKLFLAYAAECLVEDLHVDLRHCKSTVKFNFHFPLSSPRLLHLSLRHINICSLYYKGAQPFYALEVIHLQSVTIAVAFRKFMALCPRLHTLDLRRCDLDGFLYGAKPFTPPAGVNLRSITVAECRGEARLVDVAVPSLRSFRYNGNCGVSSFFLPKDAALADLYICSGDPIPMFFHWTVFANYIDRRLPDDLSRLTVLTICSNTLKAASSLLNDGATAQLTCMRNLQSLRELQLLMFGMDTNKLADIYLFLKASYCPNLERFFVQLPAISDVPVEGLLEEVEVEQPEDGLGNLRTVKVTNFNWRRIELQLVSFLLRKASSLRKLLLVSPNTTPMNVAGVPEADLLLLKESLANGHIVLSESDNAATQPFHSEVFVKH